MFNAFRKNCTLPAFCSTPCEVLFRKGARSNFSGKQKHGEFVRSALQQTLRVLQREGEQYKEETQIYTSIKDRINKHTTKSFSHSESLTNTGLFEILIAAMHSICMYLISYAFTLSHVYNDASDQRKPRMVVPVIPALSKWGKRTQSLRPVSDS